MNAGWIRERGRADYSGFVVRVHGSRAEGVFGHPLVTCCAFWLAWKLGFLRRAPLVGEIAWLKVEHL